MYKDYIILNYEKIHGAADPKHERGQNMSNKKMTFDDFFNDFQFSQFENKERKTNPGAFLLTEQEHVLIEKASLCIYKIVVPFSNILEEFKGEPEILNKILNDIFDGFKEQKINPEKLRSIIDKTKQGLFWSLVPEMEQYKDKNGTVVTTSTLNLKITISIEEQIKNIILDDNHPFFKAETMQARAQALGLDNLYLYLTSFELNTIESLKYIFARYDEINSKNSKTEIITTSENDLFYRLVSSKAMKAFNIGANAKAPKVTRKRNEQGQQISIAEYISSAGVDILFTDFSPYAAGGFISVGDPNTDKLLQQAQIITALTGKQIIEISIKEFKDFRDLKDSKAAIETAKTACGRLSRASIYMDRFDSTGALTGYWNYVQKAFVAQTGNKGKNKIIIEWTNDIYKHITENIKAGQQIEQIDKRIFTIPDKQAPAYNIACKFSWHLRINAGAKNDHRLLVQTLINCVPTWPIYTDNFKDIPEKDKSNYIKYPSQAPDRIIKPFIETLNYLTNEKKIFKAYRFIGKNNKILSDAEILEARKDYKLFISLLLSDERYTIKVQQAK